MSQWRWPESLAHLARPIIAETDEYATVAHVSSEPMDGYVGCRQLWTALVPYSELAEVLGSQGGIGWKVECWGPGPVVPSEGGYDGSFWVQGTHTNKRYEVIVNGWHHHDRVVLSPDDGFLMCYGLIPRALQDGTVHWDDPSKPVHDVVRVRPLSNYHFPEGYSTASVEIRREYLEDYLSLKGCSAVSVFFEERYSTGDQIFAEAIGKNDFLETILPGYRVQLRQVDPSVVPGHTQLSQVWGCSFLLRPSGRPVSDEHDPDLVWPGRDVSKSAYTGLMDYVYVRDEVLREYESRDEITVNPESGYVGYGSWWSVGYCRRFGRNHIALELRKLYEGTPPYVIRHFHQYSVSEAQAEADRVRYGDLHIGTRARNVVEAYLSLTKSIGLLSTQASLYLELVDIGGFDPAQVEYVGWSRVPSLRPLGFVSPVGLSREEFLGRCGELYKLLENLKPSSLKQILKGLGLPKDAFVELGSLKLLATLCQLKQVAVDRGDDMVADCAHVVPYWNKNIVVPAMTALFALNRIRQLNAHTASGDLNERLKEPAKDFDIDITATRHGWGIMLDKVYDKVGESLSGLADLLQR